MNTEDDFQRALDANPEDWQTRLVFADWLEERGDPRAEGYRALGVLRLRPARARGGIQHGGTRDEVWGFTTEQNPDLKDQTPNGPLYITSALARDWYELFRPSEVLPSWDSTHWAHCYSRREVEDAATLAFASLPPERRAELLADAPDGG